MYLLRKLDGVGSWVKESPRAYGVGPQKVIGQHYRHATMLVIANENER